jgi:ribosomal protein S18 acetylase RimI-like enzyme
MTDYTQPLNLDDVLAARQYRKIGETAVYTLPLFNQSLPQANVQITSHLTPQWLNAFMSLNTIHPDHHVTFERMMKLIPETCARGYVSLLQGDTIVGVALGVLDAGWLGVFDVFVQPNYRGHGYGRTVVEALLAWGVSHGAERAYLQVQKDNSIALQLYQSLGFSEQYRYWYRVKDLHSGA